MARFKHRLATGAEAHIPHGLEYANETEMRAVVTLTADRLNTIVMLLDTKAYFRVADFNPPTFVPCIPPTPEVGDIGKAVGVIDNGEGVPIYGYVSGGGGSLDDAYNAEPGIDRVIEVDDGDVVLHLADGNAFCVDNGEAGTPVALTDGDCEAVDMTNWTIVSGASVKNTDNQQSGLRGISLDGGISQSGVLTIGVSTTVGIWIKRQLAGTAAIKIGDDLGVGVVIGDLPDDETHHYYEATFTPTSTNMLIEESLS